LTEKFLCTTTHVATLRSAEVLVTTFTDCLQQETVLKPLIRELMLQLSQLRHENIAGYLGCATDSHFPDGQAIITERYPDSLSNKLFGQQSSPLSPFLRLDIALGISSGLAYIHNLHTHSPFASLPQDFPLSSLFFPRPLLHGNLTSENIQLLQQILPSGEVRYIAKISNIAIAATARRYLSAQAPSSMLFASATSAPPESRFGHYDQKSEVFSLGVILVELLTARPASAVMELMERGLASTNATGFQTRFKERYLDRSCLWDDKLWSGLFAIAKLCLKKSREERPDAAAVEGSLTALLQQLTTPPDAVPTPTAKAKTLLRKSSTGINAAAAVATARRQSSQSLSGRLSSASATGSTRSTLPSSSSSRQRKLESAAATGSFTRRSNATIAPQSRG
jgi:serine/threonine protein kinase